VKAKFYRVWYTEDSEEAMPVRSDMIIKAYWREVAYCQAIEIFKGFLILKLELDTNTTGIT